MTAFGMPNPSLWGVIAGFLNFIPIWERPVQPDDHRSRPALTFRQPAYSSTAHVFLSSNYDRRKLPYPYDRRTGLTLNPIAVFLTILLGLAMGISGALMAVPILAVFKILWSRAIPPARCFAGRVDGNRR